MKMHTILRAACILLLGAFTLHAGVPNLINYQGRLTDAQGNPVTGNRTMAVRIYDAPTGGNMTYEETIGTVSVANGTYSFQFGGAGDGIIGVLVGFSDYLALSVNGTEESTRTRLLAVPYALKARESADAQALVAQSKVLTLAGDMNFGNAMVGGGIGRTLSISNEGFLKANVTGIAYPAGFSGNWSGSIAPGATQNVTVVFAPDAVQSYGGNLVVSSDATGGSVALAVSGAGVTPRPVNMITVQGGTLPQSSQLAGHTVSTFQIGKYEVTWDEWQEVRDWGVANGYSDLANVGSGSAGNHPVQSVNWYDVVKWMNAKSESDGLVPVYQVSGSTYKTGQTAPTINSGANGYRLPTEVEWEWAARGGVSSQGYTYSGSNDVGAVAWTYGNSIGAAVNLYNGRGTWPVGQKGANELGIHDMSGNVWEWCEDLVYGSYRWRIRGGSWRHNADFAAVASWDDLSPRATASATSASAWPAVRDYEPPELQSQSSGKRRGAVGGGGAGALAERSARRAGLEGRPPCRPIFVLLSRALVRRIGRATRGNLRRRRSTALRGDFVRRELIVGGTTAVSSDFCAA